MADFNTGTLKGSIVINFGSVREAENAVKSLQSTFSSYERASSKAASSEKARIRALAQVEANLAAINRTQRSQIDITSTTTAALSGAIKATNNYKDVVERLGAGSVEATQAQADMKAAIDAANNAVREANSNAKAQVAAHAQEAKAQQTAEKARIRALAQVEANLAALNRTQRSQIDITSTTSSALRDAVKATNDYRDVVERLGVGSVEATQAQVDMRAAIAAANNAVRDANSNVKAQVAAHAQDAKAQQAVKKATTEAASSKAVATSRAKEYSLATQDITKSVQLALGPLSGVASRITALNALFSANAAVVATAVGVMTSFTVAMYKSIQAGMEFETQMYQMQAILVATGNDARFTADELEAMAVRLEEATMTSVTEARAAQNILMTFSIATKEGFEEALKAAQGLSRVMGGTLATNTRRLGRLLENPTDNFSALSRAGVSFSDSQKRVIRDMVTTGDLAEAQGIIYDKLRVFIALANEETQGLAGALDTVGGRFNRLFEQSALSAGSLDSLSVIVNRVGKELEELLENERIINSLGVAFSAAAKIIGSGVVFMVSNMELLISILGGIGVLGAVKLATAGMSSLATAMAVQAAGGANILNIALLRTSNLLSRITFVLRANPLGVALSVVAAVGGLILYNRTVDETTENINKTVDKAKELRRALIMLGDIDMAEQVKLDQENLEILEGELKVAQRLLRRAKLEQLGYETHLIASLREVPDRVKENVADLEQMVEDIEANIASLKGTLDDLDVSTKKTAVFMAAWEKPVETLKTMRDSLKDAQSEQVVFNQQLTIANKILEKFGSAGEDVLSRIEEEMSMTREEAERIVGQFIEMNDPKLANFRTVRDGVNSIKREIEALHLAARLGVDKDIAEQLVGSDPRALERMAQFLGLSESSIESIAAALKNLKAERDALLPEDSSKSRTDPIREYIDGLKEEAELVGKNEAQIAAYRIAKMAEKDATTQNIEALISEAEGYIEARRQAQASVDAAKAREAMLQDLADRYGDVTKEAKQFEAQQRLLQEMYESTGNEEYLRMLQRLREEFNGLTFDVMTFAQTIDGIVNSSMANFTSSAAQLADIFSESLSEGMQKGIVGLGAGLDSMMNLMETANRDSSTQYKRMAQVQATISGALAIAKIWGEYAAQPWIAGGLTALVSANIGAQIAAIEAQNYATGGLVRGPGTGTSDSIPANLSNGEYVLRADAVRKIGVSNLNAMNQGRMANFSSGGLVGSGSSGGMGFGNVIINDYSSGDKEYSQETVTDQNGNQNMRITIRNVMKETLARGEVDREMTSRYGVKVNGRRM